jgi:phosphopantothenoylcysteine decarboxylase/phosphopantothenate--cysteine ligase
VVVTAGPTHEHIDPVRYLANESSGKMGFELARAAVRAGHRVTLVAGPVHLETPPGVTRVDVVSAREMHAAVVRAFAEADALYMAAAVADWRPRRKRAGKWRKEEHSSEVASLDLVRNPDILATVARRKGRRFVVGFALETGAGLRRARAKLARKGADVIVWNDASALGAERTTAALLFRDGTVERYADVTKRALAQILMGLLERASGSVPG